MEAMNGIPPQIPGYTFAQKLGSGSEANVYLYQQLSPADKWPSRSARERSIRARGAVPFKRTSWAGSPRILTFFRCMKAASPPRATATPCSNTLREAITRPSNPTGSTQTRCLPSASIWRAPFPQRTAKASYTATSSPAIFSSTRMACPCFPISASRERSTGVPASATPSRGLRRKVLAKNGGGNKSSDIYSLGATLFAMLTGQSPYEYGYSAALGSTRGKERGALLRNIILTDPLPKLNRPDIPRKWSGFYARR